MTNDLISSQEAIDAFWKLEVEARPSWIDAMLNMLYSLPPAQPEPKYGEWIINSDGYYPYCSLCYQEPEGRVMTKYCPTYGAKMSGADMRGEKDAE